MTKIKRIIHKIIYKESHGGIYVTRWWVSLTIAIMVPLSIISTYIYFNPKRIGNYLDKHKDDILRYEYVEDAYTYEKYYKIFMKDSSIIVLVNHEKITRIK